MKKLYFFILCLMAVPLIATQVSGVQSGTWTSDNNPYEVTGDITVPLSDTLVLDAGVEVVFTGVFRITVEGLIEVNGTETDSVRIGPSENLTVLWESIRLEREGTGFFNTFDHCIISGAEAAVHSINSPVQVYNSRFTDCETAIDIFAIGATTPAEVHIADNIIENSIMSGIELTENSNVLIEHNTIRYNGSGPQYRGAIQIGIQSTGVTCSPTIYENIIINNHKQGIICTDMFSAGIIDAQIIENEIRENLTGIYFYNCESTVIGNEIIDNFIAGNANSGAGIMCYGSRATPYISRNTIEGNFTALYITAGPYPNLGDYTDSSHPIQGLNYFGDNIDMSNNNNSIYVDQTTTDPVMAQNNYWTSEDPTIIAQTIHDGNDSAGMPIVVFDPIASEGETQIEVNLTVSMGTTNYDFAELRVIPLDDDIDEISHEITDDEWIEIGDLAEGAYYITAYAYAMEIGVVGLGVHGTQMEPTIVEVTADMELLEIPVELSDVFIPPFLTLGEQSDEFSVPALKLITGFDYIAEPYFDYIYQDGDYLSLIGDSFWNNGWAYDEYLTTEKKLFKTLNTSVDDTWQMLLEYDAVGGSIYADATIVNTDIIEVMGTNYLSDVISVNEEGADTYYHLIEDVGLAKIRVYENEYFSGGFELIDSNVTPDGSSFPIVDGNIWYFDPVTGEDHPWNLHLSDDITLAWDAPYYDGIDFEGYRMYIDGEMFNEMDFATRSDFVPIPVQRPNVEITITAFNANFETEPSNVLLFDIQGEDENTQPQMPVASLNGNYPNPFNPETNISFNVADAKANTSIAIYNIRGEKVKTVVNTPLAIGNHTVVWNGTDNNGKSVSSGVYFLRMTSGDFTSSRKMILMK